MIAIVTRNDPLPCGLPAGGRHFFYPKHVWTPAGGWWAEAPNGQRNTLIAFAGIFTIAFGIFNVSASKEVSVSEEIGGYQDFFCQRAPPIRSLLLLAPVLALPLWMQRRPTPPREHIPSQMWAKHAAEDDPSLRPVEAEPSPFIKGATALR